MSAEVRSTAQRKDEKGRIRHGGEWLAIWSDPDSLRNDAERRVAAAAERDTLARQAALAASIRSIANRTDIDVVFGGPAHKDAVALPSLRADGTDAKAMRGHADAQATFLRFHDKDLHRTQRPSARKAAMLFDQLEAARCCGLGADQFAGVEGNLIAHQISDLQRLDLLNAHLASLIPLREALRMTCRDVFCGRVEPSIETSGFRIWNRWLRDRFSPQFEAMKADLHDQTAYGAHSISFIEALLSDLPGAGEIDRRLSPTAPEPEARDEDGALRESDEDLSLIHI